MDTFRFWLAGLLVLVVLTAIMISGAHVAHL
jgi:hypothetical protein